jgi:hypothetical protein
MIATYRCRSHPTGGAKRHQRYNLITRIDLLRRIFYTSRARLTIVQSRRIGCSQGSGGRRQDAIGISCFRCALHGDGGIGHGSGASDPARGRCRTSTVGRRHPQDGAIQADFLQTTGNSHLNNGSLLGELSARSESLRLTVLGRHIYGDNGGNLIVCNNLGTIKLDFFLTKRLYWSPPLISNKTPFKI